MAMPERSGRPNAVRTVLRRLVFGAFVGTVTAIVLLVGMVVLSVAGVLFDPHGYGMFGAILGTAVLTPVGLLLWWLYVVARRH
ncbi:hypothetical protein [Nocardia brasiliensis]|uniref:hypothetical protein n=1 Tax=Nocardia brasiliensis TaxID=37326 RepID=UPI001EEB9D2A|nr:hypothetical protein [Nocardia brasiliensis]